MASDSMKTWGQTGKRGRNCLYGQALAEEANMSNITPTHQSQPTTVSKHENTLLIKRLMFTCLTEKRNSINTGFCIKLC